MEAPVVSEGYYQCPMPANHPYWEKASAAQFPRSVWSTQPVLLASVVRIGFPTRILLRGTPRAAISETAVPLKTVPVA